MKGPCFVFFSPEEGTFGLALGFFSHEGHFAEGLSEFWSSVTRTWQDAELCACFSPAPREIGFCVR